MTLFQKEKLLNHIIPKIILPEILNITTQSPNIELTTENLNDDNFWDLKFDTGKTINYTVIETIIPEYLILKYFKKSQTSININLIKDILKIKFNNTLININDYNNIIPNNYDEYKNIHIKFLMNYLQMYLLKLNSQYTIILLNENKFILYHEVKVIYCKYIKCIDTVEDTDKLIKDIYKNIKSVKTKKVIIIKHIEEKFKTFLNNNDIYVISSTEIKE